MNESNYDDLLNYIEELTQLAQTMISDSQLQFKEAFSNAQDAYDADSYDEAKLQINNALMLNTLQLSTTPYAIFVVRFLS